VTLPHKEKIFAHLDAVEPRAQKLGAGNTVTGCEERLALRNHHDYLEFRALGKEDKTSRKQRGDLRGGWSPLGPAACRVAHAGAQVFVCARGRGGAQAGESGRAKKRSARGIAHVEIRRAC